jgi:hypothetical protein
MSVKAWINRVENKNSYLPIIKEDAKALTGNSIISEIIYNDIPSKGKLQFKLHGLHKQTSINAIIPALIILEENIKPAANTTSSIQNKKQGQNTNLKNPCCLHGGNHEWDDCCTIIFSGDDWLFEVQHTLNSVDRAIRTTASPNL